MAHTHATIGAKLDEHELLADCALAEVLGLPALLSPHDDGAQGLDHSPNNEAAGALRLLPHKLQEAGPVLTRGADPTHLAGLQALHLDAAGRGRLEHAQPLAGLAVAHLFGLEVLALAHDHRRRVDEGLRIRAVGLARRLVLQCEEVAARGGGLAHPALLACGHRPHLDAPPEAERLDDEQLASLKLGDLVAGHVLALAHDDLGDGLDRGARDHAHLLAGHESPAALQLPTKQARLLRLTDHRHRQLQRHFGRCSSRHQRRRCGLLGIDLASSEGARSGARLRLVVQGELPAGSGLVGSALQDLTWRVRWEASVGCHIRAAGGG
mmetsp:Transcript_45330/g.130881  ORF Transcript_45330/g.130881 Transcript_45330/m.130881 type:complete len:324 (+) Transcript_45330:897-1868(+)